MYKGVWSCAGCVMTYGKIEGVSTKWKQTGFLHFIINPYIPKETYPRVSWHETYPL